MQQLKITVIGAGSTYTPELIEGLMKRHDELPVSELYLMDIDPRKLEVVGGLAHRMLQAGKINTKLILTSDLEAAVRDADFVICQIRVGRLEARITDEKIPLQYNLIGQETTGVGGFMNALRTIPVMSRIAEVVEHLAPDAWIINFTNPSGIITELLLNQHRVKAIGLCNGPINMQQQALKRIPAEFSATAQIEYIGLNHLSWITNIYCRGKELLQEQLTGEVFRAVNLPEIEFDNALLQEINAIPCSYLTYYYYRDQSLEHLKQEPKSRGEVCRDLEAELLRLYQQPDRQEKPAILEQRGGYLYSEVAISLIDAIYNDKNEEHIVDVKNQGALSFMAADDIVEVKCLINQNGAKPLPVKDFQNQHIIGMMQIVKSYEKLTVQAGLTGDYQLALKALLNHPLIGDYRKAKAVLDHMLAANQEFLPQFFS